MLSTIWGYTPEDTLESIKEIGSKISAVKQIFSALLFSVGIKGTCVNIISFEKNTFVKIKLHIDSEKVFEKDFLPHEAKEYYFELEEVIIPKSKIEVILEVMEGSVQIPLSSIGVGMGFQKTETEKNYQPTNHLALGLLIP